MNSVTENSAFEDGGKAESEVMVEDAGVPEVDAVAEKRVLLKQDLFFLPIMFIMFYIAYLDRGAIGNARLMGLQEDLSLSNQQYLECLMIFFVGNVIVALPIALGIRQVPARFIFGPCVVAFGLSAALVAVCGGYGGLMTLRFLLGCGEGILTMGFLYLGQWYRPQELALRYGIMYWSAPISGFSSGLISYGIQKDMEGTHGISSWKWLFIIEGAPAVALGVVMGFVLPSLPDRVARTGHFLFPSQQEKVALLARTEAARNVPHATIKPRQILVAFKDPKTWFMALIQGAPSIGISAFAVLLPTIIRAIGFDPLTANLYTIIPYSFAVVMLPIGCYISDKYQTRAKPYAFFCILSLIGFIILLSNTNKAAALAGCCFVAAGCYPNICIGIAWNNSVHGGWTKRSTAFAVAQFTFQAYGVIATQVYRNPPRYFLGHGVLLACYALGLISCVIMYCWQRNENMRRDIAAVKRRTGELPPLGDIGTFEDLCDFHPDYRYVY